MPSVPTFILAPAAKSSARSTTTTTMTRSPYGDHMVDKDVTIGDNVWLGNNVIILGGVTIGEGVIIQAGSVVCKSIPAYSIAGGHPAVPFKQRDVEHYEELKRLGRFH